MDEYGQRICPSNKHHLWSSIHTWQRQETHLSMGCLSIRLNEYAVINDKVMMPIVSMRVLPNGILKHTIYTHLLAGYSYCALVVYYGWNWIFKKALLSNKPTVCICRYWYSVLLCLNSHILFHLLDNETETELKMWFIINLVSLQYIQHRWIIFYRLLLWKITWCIDSCEIGSHILV